MLDGFESIITVVVTNLFNIFLIIAALNLPLPQYLQICITVFGVLHMLAHTVECVVKIETGE